jgi:hypothetical protein
MKRLTTYRTLFFIVLLTVMVSACKKLDLAPVNKFTDINFWTTTEKANSVLNTAYSQMFRSDYFFYNEGASDNAYNGRGDARAWLRLQPERTTLH